MKKDTQTVKEIFANGAIFEKEILHVSSDNDRSEIMHILTTYLVRDILKEHINFLYIRELSDFTLKQIVNILFKEIASEWVSYAIDTLDYTKKEALSELQSRERVRLIHSLALNYYKKYKIYIFEEIADTFIELVASVSHGSEKSVLINGVINSELIPNRTVLGVNSFDHIYKKVIAAKNAKNKELTIVQMKISDIFAEIANPDTDGEAKEKLLQVLQKYEKKAKEITAKKLDSFDAALQRVKDAFIKSLSSGIFNS